MDTTHKRAMNFLNYILFYSSLLCGAIFSISFLMEYYTNLTNQNKITINCDLKIHNFDRFLSQSSKRVVFSPNIDLTSRFNYNVKQIFLYLTVKYTIDNNGHIENREDMLWWVIIGNKRKSKQITSRVVNNLPFGNLPNEVTIELRGCRQPWVGKIGNEIYFSRNFNLDEIERN